MHKSSIVINNYSGTLEKAISKDLKSNGYSTIELKCSAFGDGEINITCDDISMSDKEVFILQSCLSHSHGASPNDLFMSLLLSIDAIKRMPGDKFITAVIPYLCYSRQDRIVKNSSISAKLVATMLQSAGADQIITMDAHFQQIQGLYDIPFINLNANEIFLKDIENNKSDNIKYVAPDAGSVARVRKFAECDDKIIIIDKHRSCPGKSDVMNIIGNVKDANCIIVDDMIDGGGTICNAANALKKYGAKSVCAYITHGVLSGKAYDRINDSDLDCLNITDTISGITECDKIKIVPMKDVFVNFMRQQSHTS